MLEHAILAIYPFRLSYFLFGLCVDLDDIYMLCMIAWCMTALFLHDACVTYLCGSHIYPLTFNPLVSIISFILVLIFANVCGCFSY